MNAKRVMPVAAIVLCSLSVSAQPVWTATTTTGAPSARGLHTAVWTGSKMIVWGGHEPRRFNALNDGGLYDPVVNTWTAMTTSGAPAVNPFLAISLDWFEDDHLGRERSREQRRPVRPGGEQVDGDGDIGRANGGRRHTAVWTGSKMIVWGGGDRNGVYLNSGGLYDPEGNTWTAMTTTGAPTGRANHTAVWTGSKMIVWGGADRNGVSLNNGGLYDPVANTWTAVTATGAPSARASQLAVWTGSRMIAWGGYSGGSVYPNDGGQYDPVANGWTAMTTTGAPSSRSSPTAVWTGSRMVVWGGFDGGSTTFNDGGQYDPERNTWTADDDIGRANRTRRPLCGLDRLEDDRLGRDREVGRLHPYLNDGGQWAASEPAWILPSSAHAPGLNGAFFTTDLTVTNVGAADGTITVKFLGHDADGRSGPEVNHTVGAGMTTVLSDILGSAFGVASDYGAIQIRSSATLAIAGETSTPAPDCGGGTFGQSVLAVSYTSLIAGGSSKTIPGIREDSSFRTNLILSNGSESPTDVSVALVLSDGSTAGTKTYHLEPLGMHQAVRVVRDIGYGSEVSGARLVLTTSGVVAAYASAIDNFTNDPRTLLPQ